MSLGALILNHSDKLSKTLQHATLSTAEGRHLAKLTLDVLKSIRQPEHFRSFYQCVLLQKQQLDIGSPCLPRKRRVPRHFQVGSSDGDFHSSVEDHYRVVYYEALDLVTTGITERLDQPGYKIYQNVEDLILKACQEKQCE